jgi:hypothetical protein
MLIWEVCVGDCGSEFSGMILLPILCSFWVVCRWFRFLVTRWKVLVRWFVACDALVVQFQDTLDDRDLSMTTHVLHTMTPNDLTVLEQELAADLEQISTLEFGSAFCFGHACPLLHLPLSKRNVFHVFWSLGSDQVQSKGHA